MERGDSKFNWLTRGSASSFFFQMSQNFGVYLLFCKSERGDYLRGLRLRVEAALWPPQSGQRGEE